MSDEFAITVDGLSKVYGSLRAVDNISFSVRRGELFAFLGPNGAGKTTTTEIIETIRTPTSGTVTILGRDVVKEKAEIVKRIGVLPQEFSSFDRITVKETIEYFSRLFGVRRPDVDGLIRLVNLQEKRNELYKNLSGGLKQRLGIAISLVNDPEIVFLDEPTTGLDPRARREVWNVLLGLKKKGKTIFLTTHYMEEAELLADTVAIISKGKIIAMGSPDELIERNTDHLIITFKCADAKVAETANAIGYETFRVSNSNIQVKAKRTEDLQIILDALKNTNASYRSLDVRKSNLEEVFLKMTGEQLGGGVDDATDTDFGSHCRVGDAR